MSNLERVALMHHWSIRRLCAKLPDALSATDTQAFSIYLGSYSSARRDPFLSHHNSPPLANLHLSSLYLANDHFDSDGIFDDDLVRRVTAVDVAVAPRGRMIRRNK